MQLNLKTIDIESLWIKHPVRKLPSTTLTFAVYGGLSSLGILFLAFFLTSKTGNDVFVKYLAEILGVFNIPNIISLSLNEFAKTKYKNKV
ncbi:MAG: hypothetical protein KDB74_07085 [Flavobacteriales bacterium]|nr:hypothetical protein [Flavobacteriales bacterium]